ncbi:hypothetical protein RRG08_045947 [Elysia crispata]|uniref:Secreted protein n=1 Tax=Elysia crispata TaxID=231223 RepID=A0AAE1E2U9_9GAST|nr:hypothetical protein RRG08_045947 [Elysia crispata]
MNRKHTFVLRGLVLLLSLIAKIYSNVTPELENSALNKPTVQGPRTHRYIDHYYKSSFAVDGPILGSAWRILPSMDSTRIPEKNRGFPGTLVRFVSRALTNWIRPYGRNCLALLSWKRALCGS